MARCADPFLIDGAPVPCGRCFACKATRISGWSFRLQEEAKHARTAYFVTLTYDEQTVPLTKNNMMTLDKRDIQLFMKKLRKAHPGVKLKYYVAGEYGGRTMRPHYHMILFNADLDYLIGKKLADQVLLGLFPLDGKQQVMSEKWDKGYLTVGQVTPASVGYTLKYISKKGKIPVHENDFRQPEFSLMSKKLGISYAQNREIRKWHKGDLVGRMYVQLSDGKRAVIPRYLKKKIYGERQLIRANSAIVNKVREDEKEKKLAQLQKEDQIRIHKALKTQNYDDRNDKI